MELVGADADLGAEAELAAVVEAGAGVDQHGRAVHLGDEPAGGGEVAGDDRLGVPRAVPVDVSDRPASIESTTPTARILSRNSVSQSDGWTGTIVGDDGTAGVVAAQFDTFGAQGLGDPGQEGRGGVAGGPAASRRRCRRPGAGPWR